MLNFNHNQCDLFNYINFHKIEKMIFDLTLTNELIQSNLFFRNDSPNQVIQNLKKKHKQLALNVQYNKRKVYRLKRKVFNLHQIVKSLRDKRLLSDNALAVLEKSYAGLPYSIFKKYINAKKSKGVKIPDDIKAFALTLHFYSSKAYDYVRKTFNLALPAPSTMRKWLANVDCEPGFTSTSFNILKSMFANEHYDDKKCMVCSITVDEMSIKKQIEFKGTKTWGYEDCGVGIKDDSLKPATEAFVVMAVGINSHWKIPLGYFFVNSLTGGEKANIVKEILFRLYEINVKVTSITCDGPIANFTMAEELGARVKNISDIKPYFLHPCDKYHKIYVIFDACHMIKLVRNNWASLKIIVNGKKEIIDWGYVDMLHQLQQKEGLKFANKLGRQHMQWQQQKMKVCEVITPAFMSLKHFPILG